MSHASKKLVCRAAEVPENGMKECQTEDGLKVLVANSAGDLFAYQAHCPHQDVPLCEGMYDGDTLTCHQHLWQWKIRTGEPIGLAEAPLAFYDVQLEDGALYIVSPSTIAVSELFSGISDKTQSALNDLARREDHDAGAIVYRPGDPADDFYILDSGRVEFLIGRGEHASPAGFMLRKGEVFGWAGLIESEPRRIARATCLEKSSLLRINGSEALAVLQNDPLAGYTVMRRLSSLIVRHLATSGPT